MKSRRLLPRKTRFFQGCLVTIFLPLFLGANGDRALSQTPIYPNPIPPSRRDITLPIPRCFPNLALPPRPILRPTVLFLPGEELFGELALEYSRLGKQQQVLVLLENITRNESKALILLQLAEIYRERENFADAIENLDRALAIVRPEENMRLLAFISLEFIRVGRVEKSLAISRDLDETWQANILQKIAFNLISTGQIERANQIALTLTENRDRIEIWSEIFRAYFEEDPDNVTAFLQTIPDECDRDRVLYKAIERGWDGGDRVRELLDLIESSRMQELSRIKIATHLAESGRFEQALEIAELITASAPRARALIAIAASLRQNRQEDRAVQILDRARQLTENLRIPGSWGISN